MSLFWVMNEIMDSKVAHGKCCSTCTKVKSKYIKPNNNNYNNNNKKKNTLKSVWEYALYLLLNFYEINVIHSKVWHHSVIIIICVILQVLKNYKIAI